MYKRQVQGSRMLRNVKVQSAIGEAMALTVSYTHLDVYKRQEFIQLRKRIANMQYDFEMEDRR